MAGVQAKRAQTIAGRRRKANVSKGTSGVKIATSNLKTLGCGPVENLEEVLVVYDDDEIYQMVPQGTSRPSLHVSNGSNIYGLTKAGKPKLTTKQELEDSQNEAASLIFNENMLNNLAKQIQTMQTANPDLAAQPDMPAKTDFQAIAEEDEKAAA